MNNPFNNTDRIMPIPVTKYRCGFKCGKAAMSIRKDAEKHEAGCFKNPANRSCATCINEKYERDSDEDNNVWHYRGCKLKTMNEFFDNMHEKLETGMAAKHIKPVFHCPNWGKDVEQPETETFIEEVSKKIIQAHEERNKPVIPF